MSIQKYAVPSSRQLVTDQCVVETGNHVPELSDAVQTGMTSNGSP